MQTELNRLLTPQRLGDAEPAAVRLVMAIRIAALCSARKVDVLPAIAERTGCQRLALRLLHFIAVAGNAWPEPFIVSPPCCRALSHDETLLVALTEAANDDDRPRFDRHSADLLNEEVRDLLWRELAALVRRHS